ncbi:MAG: hypothetical protein WCH57_08830 [Verrucomicrobiota bacterium]
MPDKNCFGSLTEEAPLFDRPLTLKNIEFIFALHAANSSQIHEKFTQNKTEADESWHSKHPRWRLHFTPPHSRWLNQVERFFAKITAERNRRGVIRGVAELQAAIEAYITTHNIPKMLIGIYNKKKDF